MADTPSYLPLARKYRPQIFEDVIGQDHVVKTLSGAILADKVHHAYVFSGTRGVGKTTIARILARALNCEQGPTPKPCGTCAACQEITSGGAMDVIEIDAASHTKVEQIREILATVVYRPSRLRRKVYILDEAHMLSKASFNALLKTLEEPPGHVVFVLATTEPHKIPETVLSRSQRHSFRDVDTDTLVGNLGRVFEREGVKYEMPAVRMIAREARGSVRDSLSLADQVLAHNRTHVTVEMVRNAFGVVEEEVFLRIVRGVLQRDVRDVLAAFREIFVSGMDAGKVVWTLAEIFRDVAVAGALHGEISGGDETIAERQKLAGLRPPEDLLRLFEVFATEADMALRSSVAIYRIEMLLVKLATMAAVADLASIVSALQSEGSGGAPPMAGGGGRTFPAPAAQRAQSGSLPGSMTTSAAPDVDPVRIPVSQIVPSDWLALVRAYEPLQFAQAFLNEQTVVSTDSHVEIRCGPADGFLKSQLERHSDALGKFLSLRAGRPVRVAVQLSGNGNPAAQARPSETGIDKQAILQHPAVVEIQREFEGSVVEIRPLGARVATADDAVMADE